MKHSRILQIQIYLNIVIAIVMLTNYHTIKDWIYIGILIIVILINKFIKIDRHNKKVQSYYVLLNYLYTSAYKHHCSN